MEDLRQRLSFHRDSLGLVLGIAFTAFLGIAACAIWAPIGPARPVVAVITGFHLRELEEGARTYARVHYQETDALVRLNVPTDCRVGDKIHLESIRTLTGERLNVRMRLPICER
jgi:hypothetical protein